jgi:hypothetical protein
MNDYRFNRQELFTREDMRELMDIISDVEMLDGEFEGRYNYKIYTVVNQLFGLFDGVLYGDLIHNANMAMLPTSLVGRIYKLTGIVSDHLLAGGGEIEKREAFEEAWIP